MQTREFGCDANILSITIFKQSFTHTGPDGIGDHRVRVEDQFFIGHSAMSSEATNNLQYLCRAHPVSDKLVLDELCCVTKLVTRQCPTHHQNQPMWGRSGGVYPRRWTILC